MDTNKIAKILHDHPYDPFEEYSPLINALADYFQAEGDLKCICLCHSNGRVNDIGEVYGHKSSNCPCALLEDRSAANFKRIVMGGEM